MSYKVFVDGRAGTTGLKIIQRLSGREDISLLLIDNDLRRDKDERKKLINQSDFVFLCLPDDAARESVSLIENDNVKVIDASTAHRIDPQWAYGFPELSKSHYEKISVSKRVAVPGCYASGFLALVFPLVKCGIIPSDFLLYSYGISGYSGAGKEAISQYESDDKPSEYLSPRLYALGQTHKHLPEMQKISGLLHTPIFNPVINDYYSGMLVNVPLHLVGLSKKITSHEINEVYNVHYKYSKIVKVVEETSFLPANSLAGKDFMEIYVNGNDERVLLTARLDNLGKGASGAAVQCMNIMMGVDETLGLVTE